MVIGAIKFNYPEKYTDNSNYNILTGNISSIYTARLAEDLSGEAATVLEITTIERYSKVDAKKMAQRWRIGLGPAQHTLKTTTQVGIRHNFHPLTRRYMTDIIHGYNARRLNTTTNFDTLFPKFRSVNGNTCAQLFTDTEFISLHSSNSKVEAGNCLDEVIDDI